MWLGPADEAGQQVYLDFLYDVLLPRALTDGGPQDPPRRGAAAYMVERDATLDYLHHCGVRLGLVHPANSEMHGLEKFAKWRWVVAKDMGSVDHPPAVAWRRATWHPAMEDYCARPPRATWPPASRYVIRDLGGVGGGVAAAHGVAEAAGAAENCAGVAVWWQL